jgi:4-hydroxybenzoate polyprenyltransferase
MNKYLRLVRLPNLLIVALTLYLMRWFILKPLLDFAGYTLLLSEWKFILLVLSAVSYTAAGYAINDYFDTRTDMLNKPREVLVGKSVSRREAILIHFSLNSIGAIFGIYISFAIGIPALSTVCILIPGILWFYSTSYKRQFLIGNLIVAMLTALIPMAVFLSEAPLQYKAHGEAINADPSLLHIIFYWIAGFSFFAFSLTLVREIVKDVEDFEGDAAIGRNSLPVVYGIPVTKWIISILIIGIILVLGYVCLTWLFDTFSIVYITIALIFPLVLIMYLLYMAETKVHYARISLILKFIMLAGLLYALIANYILGNNLNVPNA